MVLIGGWLVQFTSVINAGETAHQCEVPEPTIDEPHIWECDVCQRHWGKSWFQRNAVLPVSGDSA